MKDLKISEVDISPKKEEKKYKVEYYSEGGTFSDNNCIGVYETLDLAKDAKRRYIIHDCGFSSKKDYLINNPNATEDEIEDWVDYFQDMKDNILIEEVINF